jgi:hypothetical protein
MTNLPLISVRYNRVFVNNRVRNNQVSLYIMVPRSKKGRETLLQIRGMMKQEKNVAFSDLLF